MESSVTFSFICYADKSNFDPVFSEFLRIKENIPLKFIHLEKTFKKTAQTFSQTLVDKKTFKKDLARKKIIQMLLLE